MQAITSSIKNIRNRQPGIKLGGIPQTKLGFELSVLKNRFNSEILIIFKDTPYHIFMSASQRKSLPYFGASPVAANIGKQKTKGYELEFNSETRPRGTCTTG